MPRVYYNLDQVPDDIWSSRTIFLIGPSARGTSSTSYRAEFIKHLTQVEEETGIEYVVFNPEGPNWGQGKASAFAKWELEQLQRSSVIVIGLDNEPTSMPGLTTRTEAGFLLANRRNLIMWRPPNSYKTGYIAGRFEERPYLWQTESLEEAAKMVPEVYQTNLDQIDVREARFNAAEIRPNGCDPYYLETVMRTIEEDMMNRPPDERGAVYVYLPLFDEYGYGQVVKKMGGYGPFIQTPKYNIVYKWMGLAPDKVHPAASSIAGAAGMILNVERTHCLLVYEESYNKTQNSSRSGSWNFPGGAVDRGELDFEAFLRELKEEIGVELDPETVNHEIVGGHNIKAARKHGAWDPNDPPAVINDHKTFFLVLLDMNNNDMKFTVDPKEIKDIRWFPVQDIIDDKVPNMSAGQRQVVINYFDHGTFLPFRKVSPNKIITGTETGV